MRKEELLVFVQWVDHFHQYIYKRYFILSDLKLLLRNGCYIQKILQEVAYWLENLLKYDFFIQYRTGRVYKNVDATSQRTISIIVNIATELIFKKIWTRFIFIIFQYCIQGDLLKQKNGRLYIMWNTILKFSMTVGIKWYLIWKIIDFSFATLPAIPNFLQYIPATYGSSK